MSLRTIQVPLSGLENLYGDFRKSLETGLLIREEEAAGGKILIEKKNGKMLQVLRHF